MDSKKIDDGGLAFPGNRSEQVGTLADYGFVDDDSPTFDDVYHPGMSLRDWFAGQALAGMMASETVGGFYYREDEAADRAYRIATAMISARKAGAE